MSKRQRVTPNHVTIAPNDIFHCMDGIMPGFATKKTEWKEVLYFGMKFMWQMSSKYRTEVTSTPGMLLMSVHILDPFLRLHSSWMWGKQMDIFPRTRLLLLSNTTRHFWSVWRMNSVPNINIWLSLNPTAYYPSISSLPQWLQDLVNHPMIHKFCPVMMKSTICLKMCPKRHPGAVFA
jgi:hypothetical protein